MRKQPFLPIALALIAGILTAEYAILNPAIPLISAIGCLAAVFVFRRKSLPASILLCFATFFLGNALLQRQKAAICDHALASLPTYSKITAFGAVVSEPIVNGDRIRFTLALKAIRVGGSWQVANGKLQVMMKTPAETYQLYEALYVTGNLIWPLSERNPDDFNYKRYLNLQGVQAVLRIRFDGRVVQTGAIDEPLLPFKKWIGSIHRTIGRGLDTLFVPEAAVVLRGLLLGDRTNIDQGITDNFARSGVIHILAVSGLHVGFVMAFCVMIGWLIRLKERELIILTLCVIWAYALITGVKPPVVRASAMASIFIIGRYRDKPINGGNLLAFAAILLLIFRPEEIFQAGFQLSFAAVAGILLLFPKIDHFFKSVCWIDKLYRYRIGRWIFGLMAVSFAAQIATLPFSAYHFGRVSFVGVFANLVVIPAIFITVISSVISLALLPLSMSLAQLLGAIPNGIVLFIIWLTDNIAGMSFSGLENWYPPIWVLLLYITVILALLYWQNMAIRFSTIAVVLALLNVAVWENIITGGPKLKATFLNVGQGDASFIQTPSGQNILIDAGRATPDYDAGKEVILPFFERHGIEKLDLVFITHPHFDHFGGLPAILKAMPVSKVAFVDTAYKSKSFRKLLDILQIEGVPIHIAKRGQIIDDFSPVQIWISGPALEYAKQNNRPNESSLTLQICYGKNVLLFMGDTQWRGEERMLPYGNLLSSEILKVGHHGSRTSSTAPFLDFVKPNYAVISVGAFNRFKHPSFAVTSRLAAIECDTLRTDLSGALVFTSDGRTIERVK